MLVNLVRFFKGNVDFTAHGRFPERFLNITAARGILLWNAHPIEGGLSGTMSISDYRKIRPIARRAKVQTKIQKKHGLPFIIHKYKGRPGIFVGAVLGVIMLIIISQFVWSFKIVGAEGISEQKITEALAERGVKVGAYKGGFDVEEVERSVLLELDELTWMSINLLGCNASVEVREKYKKPEISIDPPPCNIKAARDGVVTKVNSRNGETLVKVGSGVAKGDLLVSGMNISKLDTVHYVRADADVFADVISQRELKALKRFGYYSLSENKIDRKRLSVLSAELPFSLSFGSFENTAYSKYDERLVINDTMLPFGFSTERASELIYHDVAIDSKTAEKIFRNSELLYEVFERPDSKVLSRSLTVTENKECFTCEIDAVFNENIAEAVEFSVTDN